MKKLFPFTKPIVFGHRGYSSKAAENTLPAFKLLLDHNIQGVEFDVHMCASGELVVIHDFITERVFKEKYIVEKTPYSILKQLEIKESFHFADWQNGIPLLQDVFRLLGKNVIYDIELKSNKLNNSIFVHKVIEMVDQFGLREQAIISSFNPFCVRTVRKTGFENTALIYSNDDSIPIYLRKGEGKIIAKPKFMKPNYEDLDKSWHTHLVLKNAHNILTWTVDNLEIAKKLLQKGICGFISNDPKPLSDILTTP